MVAVHAWYRWLFSVVGVVSARWLQLVVYGWGEIKPP